MILLLARTLPIVRLLMNSHISRVDLYGSSTRECGVDRGDRSSDTFSGGIYRERKIFAGLLHPADYVRNIEVPQIM
jgi:hypothetical protein